MPDWLSEIFTYLGPLLSFLGGGGLMSIFYFKQNKRLKESEAKSAEAQAKAAEVDVKTAEISNLSASNEEWIKLYQQVQEEKNRVEEQLAVTTDKLDEIYRSKDLAWDRYSDSRAECNKKDMVIAELNWYRCEVNGCPYRKPPRKFGDTDFPKDGVDPNEHPDPDYV